MKEKSQYLENIDIDNLDDVNIFELMFNNRKKYECLYYLDESICS